MEPRQSKLRRSIVNSAFGLHSENIRDDGGPAPKVTTLFDENGWGRWLRAEDLGGCPEGYTRPPDPDYCGHTVAYITRWAGAFAPGDACMDWSMNEAIASKILPSTYRIDQGWDKVDGFERPTLTGFDPLPGDICVVGPTSAKPYGSHIVMATSEPDSYGEYKTIEGNAPGRRFDGTWGKGVVKRSRTMEETVRILPVIEDHYDV